MPDGHPDRHPADLQSARGPGPHVLRGHAGHGRGKGHHQPPGALDRAGRQHEPAGIPLDRRRQRRAELLSNDRPTPTARWARSCRWRPERFPLCRRERFRPSCCRSIPPSTVPACIIALDSKTQSESILYDVGRYEVRNMIMAIPGAVAPVVFGGKVRTVLAYLDREKMQARQITLTDVMNALDRYNLFMPTGDAKFGDTDLRHRLELDVQRHRRNEGHPASHRAGQRHVSGRRGDARGHQFHPDQHRAGQRAAAGLHSGLPATRLQHAQRGRSTQDGSARDGAAADARRHQPESGDGPVGLRPPVDQGAGAGGAAGGRSLLAGDPDLSRASCG